MSEEKSWYSIYHKWLSFKEKALILEASSFAKVSWEAHFYVVSYHQASDFESRKRSTGPFSLVSFGRGGIRTHVTFITSTRFPSVLLKPLGHSSNFRNIYCFE